MPVSEKKEKVRVEVRLDPDMHEILRKKAFDDRRSIISIVVEALKEYLKKDKNNY